MKKIDFSLDDFLEKIKTRSTSSRVKYQFQLIGLQLATILNDQKNKSLYIKIAKQRQDYGYLLNLANSIKENDRIDNKGAMFMNELYKRK